MKLSISKYGNIEIISIPTKFTPMEECNSKKAFIQANFALVMLGEDETVVCDPDNAIAFCQLVYDFMIKTEHKKVFDKLGIDCPTLEWFVNDHDEASKWLESGDELGIVRELIQLGKVLTVPKGKKHGPLHGNEYYSNDYLILPEYKKYLSEGILFEGLDELIDDYAKDYVLDGFIASGMGCSFITDPACKKFIKFGWFDRIDVEDIKEALMIVVDQTDEFDDWENDPEDIVKNVKAVAKYLKDRGVDVDPKAMAETYLENAGE